MSAALVRAPGREALPSRPMVRGLAGFSLLELVVAMAITLVVSGAMFQLVAGAGRGVSRDLRSPEALQRLRAAADILLRDLLVAGAGLNDPSAPDDEWVAPVRPAASGPWHREGERAFATDRISVAYRAGGLPGGSIVRRVYYHDRPARRLMLHDGDASGQPAVDEVELVRFAYFVDPDPDSLVPPPAGAGNCVFGAGAPPVALLVRHPGTALREASVADLTDGPSCGPDGERFDGDLLRVRLVRVTVAVAERVGARVHSATFDVAPRGLNLTR